MNTKFTIVLGSMLVIFLGAMLVIAGKAQEKYAAQQLIAQQEQLQAQKAQEVALMSTMNDPAPAPTDDPNLNIYTKYAGQLNIGSSQPVGSWEFKVEGYAGPETLYISTTNGASTVPYNLVVNTGSLAAEDTVYIIVRRMPDNTSLYLQLWTKP